MASEKDVPIQPVNPQVGTVQTHHNFVKFPTTHILSRTKTPVRRGVASDIRTASQ
jgi:hypothetical protein